MPKMFEMPPAADERQPLPMGGAAEKKIQILRQKREAYQLARKENRLADATRIEQEINNYLVEIGVADQLDPANADTIISLASEAYVLTIRKLLARREAEAADLRVNIKEKTPKLSSEEIQNLENTLAVEAEDLNWRQNRSRPDGN